MDRFVARFNASVTGVLSGFDRIVFRGSLIPLIRDRGMYTFLLRAGVRLLDFKKYVTKVSDRVVEAAMAEARAADRPVRYLHSSTLSKEDLARSVLGEQPVNEGLICLLRIVEPCMSFEYHLSQDKKLRGLKLRPRKCLHLYKYFMHPRFGFMNARIQTWFPFNIQICLNGREWLGHQMSRAGRVDFTRHDNCFTSLGDVGLAQGLMDDQLALDWGQVLDEIACSLNPLHDEIFEPWPQTYFWSAYQTEWATDIMFENPRALAAIYPALVRHATLHFKSGDVMRFLSKKAHGRYLGELTTSFKDRAEGVRVKHWVQGNSIKMYDKAGSVLRVETTIANPVPFKAFRTLQNDPDGPRAWRPMRKGIADLHRRAEVSQLANRNYLDALAVVDENAPLSKLLDDVSRPSTYNGRCVRGLRIGDRDDVALLEAVARGEFKIAGFRNRDLRAVLYPTKRDATLTETKKLSARVSRLLRVLRAHGVIHKIPKSHRYKLSPMGQTLTAALFAARSAPLKKLLLDAA